MWNDTDRGFSGLGKGISNALEIMAPQIMAQKRQQDEAGGEAVLKAYLERQKMAQLERQSALENASIKERSAIQNKQNYEYLMAQLAMKQAELASGEERYARAAGEQDIEPYAAGTKKARLGLNQLYDMIAERAGFKNTGVVNNPNIKTPPKSNFYNR